MIDIEQVTRAVREHVPDVEMVASEDELPGLRGMYCVAVIRTEADPSEVPRALGDATRMLVGVSHAFVHERKLKSGPVIEVCFRGLRKSQHAE